MAVLSADVIFDNVRTADRDRFEVINGDIVYQGGYTAMGGENHGTAATQGRILPWADDVGNLIPLGHCLKQKTGDTSASPIPFTGVQLFGQTVENLAVTGAGGTFTDIGLPVYAIDDGNYTLTRPTTIGWPVGVVFRESASGYADVYFFSFGEMAAMSLRGGGKESVLLGTVSGIGSTGNLMTGIKMNHSGKVTAEYAICVQAPTDNDMSATINTEIGGDNVTGSAIAIAAADTLGLKIAGAAITGANVFHEGDLVDIECTQTAAGTADDGLYAIYWDVAYFLGT